MTSLAFYERRLQDVESGIDNMFRVGTITDVKFDADRKRWYVRLRDRDQGASGGDGQSASEVDADPNFHSDWLPWRSFAHGAISFSVPPRQGQRAVMKAPYGRPEMGHVEHGLYGPDAPAPHDKQDEFVMQIAAPAGQGGGSSSQGGATLRIHGTKDGLTVTVGATVLAMTGDTFQVDCAHFVVNATADVLVKAKTQELRAEHLFLGGKDGAVPIKRSDDQPSPPVLAPLAAPGGL